MSLQYVIDGCNITHHLKFIENSPKKYSDSRANLIELIRLERLCGSENNRVWVVFDGYSDSSLDNLKGNNLNIIFSCNQSADERIKKILELSDNAKNVVVVSDDKEIIFFAKGYRARAMSVEEFIENGIKPKMVRRDLGESKIGFNAMQKINEELRKLWLK